MIEARPKANFYADLKRGQDAEKKFMEKYGEFLEQTDGRRGDFIIKGTSIIIETKTDFYSHDRWPNFVMERWSRSGKPGGPYQALEHGCKYFAYWFINDDRLYFFDTYRLCRRIDMLVKKRGFKLEQRENTGYTTEFYRIPRSEFEDLMLPYHDTVERRFNVAKKKADKDAKVKK